MKYQYTIIYVDDVKKTLEFYQRAFGFELKFLHEGKDYGELKTGDCILAFANHKLGEMNLQGKYTKSNKDNPSIEYRLQSVPKVFCRRAHSNCSFVQSFVVSSFYIFYGKT